MDESFSLFVKLLNLRKLNFYFLVFSCCWLLAWKLNLWRNYLFHCLFNFIFFKQKWKVLISKNFMIFDWNSCLLGISCWLSSDFLLYKISTLLDMFRKFLLFWRNDFWKFIERFSLFFWTLNRFSNSLRKFKLLKPLVVCFHLNLVKDWTHWRNNVSKILNGWDFFWKIFVLLLNSHHNWDHAFLLTIHLKLTWLDLRFFGLIFFLFPNFKIILFNFVSDHYFESKICYQRFDIFT